MKSFTVIIALAASFSAFATKELDYPAAKAHQLESINKQIAQQGELKACVTKATSFNESNVCFQANQVKSKALQDADKAYWDQFTPKK